MTVINENKCMRRTFLAVAGRFAFGLAVFAVTGCEDEGPPPAARRKIALADLPEKIRNAATKALPGIEFEEAWENLDKERKLQSYEIKGRASNGKIREARVSLTGEILEME